MHKAASIGQVEKLQLLVDSGASVNAATADNITPLHDACVQDHPECVRVLLNAGAQVKCCLYSLGQNFVLWSNNLKKKTKKKMNNLSTFHDSTDKLDWLMNNNLTTYLP